MNKTANIPRTFFHASALALMIIAVAPGCDPYGSDGNEGGNGDGGNGGASGFCGNTPSDFTLLNCGNPASAYCAALCFQSEIRNSPEGQYGVCNFPDGTSCEEWAFLDGKCGDSFSYCNNHGGRIKNTKETDGSAMFEYALCLFPDGSECLEEEYIAGKCRPSQCRSWSLRGGCTQ
jgi:hypothetical protein